jgi:hypothetical protein
MSDDKDWVFLDGKSVDTGIDELPFIPPERHVDHVDQENGQHPRVISGKYLISPEKPEKEDEIIA